MDMSNDNFVINISWQGFWFMLIFKCRNKYSYLYVSKGFAFFRHSASLFQIENIVQKVLLIRSTHSLWIKQNVWGHGSQNSITPYCIKKTITKGTNILFFSHWATTDHKTAYKGNAIVTASLNQTCWLFQLRAVLTTDRRYQCCYCDQSFVQKSHCHRHMRSAHFALKHKCPICYKNFSRTDTLRIHVQSVHSTEILEKYSTNSSSGAGQQN